MTERPHILPPPPGGGALRRPEEKGAAFFDLDRTPVSISPIRSRSESVAASVEPRRRNSTFSQASVASWRRVTSPAL